MKSRSSVLMFLVGLFAMTEVNVVGFVAISELAIGLLAPFVFLKDRAVLKRDGFMTILVLLFLTMAGCVVASLYNGTPWPYFCRGFFALYMVFASIVCLHRLLRSDYSGIKWFLVGYALTVVLNIFMFQRGSARHAGDVALVSGAAMEETINSVLFWVNRLPAWLYLPVRGWYLQTPWAYSVSVTAFLAGFFLVCSGGSGRSAAMMTMMSCVLLFFGRKSISGLVRLKKHILVVFLALFVCGLVGKMAYGRLAQSGALGEAGARKFEEQTKRGTGVLDMLISGRVEFFSGLYCAVRNPVIGYGPWAIDWDGVHGDFLRRYGTAEDYESYLAYQEKPSALRKLSVIPSHSWIVGFWTWYGIFGLVFWLYGLRLYVKTLTTYFVSIPMWFGCFATMIPTVLWDLFFSPFGNRIMNSLLIVMCLFAKGLYQRRLTFTEKGLVKT